jgi:DNA-binding LytR/AlgR family response regulator
VSARTIRLSPATGWLLSSDVKAALLCWGAFILLLSSYCSLYQVIVSGTGPNVADSFRHVFKNWGVWLLTTPLMFAMLRKYSAKWHDRVVELAAFVALIVFISASVPIAIDLLTQARDAATSLMIFLPRYSAVVGIVYLFWHVFLRDRHGEREAVDDAPSAMTKTRAPSAPIPELPKPRATLLVSKGADQCLIQISRIECVSAAGNYVEIIERGQRYLMRATLKQMEALLPAEEFIRIHRSHFVRRDEIERIKNHPSGNGSVQLRSGRLLPMSKRYKQTLQRYRRGDLQDVRPTRHPEIQFSRHRP